MASSCSIRRKLAEEFATAARLYAESAIRLACSANAGVDYTRLRDQTVEAQRRSEVAFKGFNEHVASHWCGEITQNANGHLVEQAQPDAGPITDMCIEKQTLGAAFLNAIRDVHALFLTQRGALVESETGLDRFETALNLARERRDNAKLVFLAHIHAHGC